MKYESEDQMLADLRLIRKVKSQFEEKYNSDPYAAFQKFVDYYVLKTPGKEKLNTYIPVTYVFSVYTKWCFANNIPETCQLSNLAVGRQLQLRGIRGKNTHGNIRLYRISCQCLLAYAVRKTRHYL